jgi:hypothetical protein
VVAITHYDLVKKEQTRAELQERFSTHLGIPPTRVFVVENYRSLTVQKRNHEIERDVLCVMLGAMKEAERNVDFSLNWRAPVKRKMRSLLQNQSFWLMVLLLCLFLLLVTFVDRSMRRTHQLAWERNWSHLKC